MPYFHHQQLHVPSRFHAQSDPTPLPTRSFTIDRSSTKHTIYTISMLQLDGANESKPKPVKSNTFLPSRTPTQSSGLRKRFANLFGGQKRTETGLSNYDAGNAADIESSPMRIISPRATEYDPLAHTTPSQKHRPFSFKNRQSRRVSQTPRAATTSLTPTTSPAQPTPYNQSTSPPGPTSMSGGAGHLPVTDIPYQSPMRAQPRKDSVGMGEDLGGAGGGMPSSPSREVALRSHPVGKTIEERGSESEERFETPRSEGVGGSGFFGKYKEEAVREVGSV
ncbi:hypothetical protein EK21DRAFT_74770 [Setomelanomma holmii]|uniref:Uncharacterized protein n=1 Tax=Setomelanomma holmii TaxID=210430 RepID=A0A9P4H389_9PLEO|nr:hypothetical protein EK21DRAFT_74770 [Setomelanomma holmii]